jgi:hypothetical protein
MVLRRPKKYLEAELKTILTSKDNIWKSEDQVKLYELYESRESWHKISQITNRTLESCMVGVAKIRRDRICVEEIVLELSLAGCLLTQCEQKTFGQLTEVISWDRTSLPMLVNLFKEGGEWRMNPFNQSKVSCLVGLVEAKN